MQVLTIRRSGRMSKAAVFLAEGFEEIEAVVPIDLLRRGGVEVAIVGIGGTSIAGSHSILVEADTQLTKVEDFHDVDAVILPGGMPGARNLSESWELNELIIRKFNEGAVIGAICAAPAVVLGKLGILDGRKAVCYPGAESYAPDCTFGDESVMRDGNLITARGPGFASDFALELLAALVGEGVAEKVGSASLFR
jgi:protein deglycase